MPGRTFRFNECVCAPYNADFDGALTWALVFYFPRIQMVYVLRGFPRTNPMTWGWDWDHQSYSREGSGFLGVPWCVGRFCGGHHRISVWIWTMKFPNLTCSLLHTTWTYTHPLLCVRDSFEHGIPASKKLTSIYKQEIDNGDQRPVVDGGLWLESVNPAYLF